MTFFQYNHVHHTAIGVPLSSDLAARSSITAWLQGSVLPRKLYICRLGTYSRFTTIVVETQLDEQALLLFSKGLNGLVLQMEDVLLMYWKVYTWKSEANSDTVNKSGASLHVVGHRHTSTASSASSAAVCIKTNQRLASYDRGPCILLHIVHRLCIQHCTHSCLQTQL